VFEPQGTGFFLLLMVVFGGLLVWVALAKQVVFRVFAACLAFIPAMVFGIAAVNKFYDYYQTWGGMITDLTGQGPNSIPKYSVAGAGSTKQFDKDIGRITSTAEDAQVGYLFQTTITGALEVVNTPKEYLSQVPADQLPAFWLAAGAQDKSDVSTAESFRQLLLARLAKVPMLIVLGGGHQGSVWRTALGPMLSWMTPFLAERAAKADAAQRAARGTKSHPARSTATPRK
jgi:hypothetical protein